MYVHIIDNRSGSPLRLDLRVLILLLTVQLAALFAGAQQAASLRTILSDLGYPQPPTIIIIDTIIKY